MGFSPWGNSSCPPRAFTIGLGLSPLLLSRVSPSSSPSWPHPSTLSNANPPSPKLKSNRSARPVTIPPSASSSSSNSSTYALRRSTISTPSPAAPAGSRTPTTSSSSSPPSPMSCPTTSTTTAPATPTSARPCPRSSKPATAGLPPSKPRPTTPPTPSPARSPSNPSATSANPPPNSSPSKPPGSKPTHRPNKQPPTPPHRLTSPASSHHSLLLASFPFVCHSRRESAFAVCHFVILERSEESQHLPSCRQPLCRRPEWSAQRGMTRLALFWHAQKHCQPPPPTQNPPNSHKPNPKST